MVNALMSSTNFIVSQGEGNIVSDMNGEKVMLSISNGKYYNLGEMGGVIWDLIESPITFNQLIESLLSQYQVEREECQKQVLTFLESLNKEKLIKLEKDI
ncbi:MULTISPECIES: lasso peptide biosynthesis PqqD family chaperone [Metabacillus]|uniref:Lasso peptide biosynthesis PqqD family chaperone n=1 Tax=Metabacillus hrfriensis TaxID=3048891 RepID=A0ACD4R5J3_9BACI|nr:MULTISPECIES: lasso peptide biosynthesis PqqD family chaperone [Metabacillus]UOK56368.1 lasso peptide biosynthesis PqqD family chaperone [Bacillus sp. OVS6]WHZ55724.1 lasso peptide biosynthesis PqqD family chaperone [Metabacillus sp. CT-WN-B3]